VVTSFLNKRVFKFFGEIILLATLVSCEGGQSIPEVMMKVSSGEDLDFFVETGIYIPRQFKYYDELEFVKSINLSVYTNSIVTGRSLLNFQSVEVESNWSIEQKSFENPLLHYRIKIDPDDFKRQRKYFKGLMNGPENIVMSMTLERLPMTVFINLTRGKYAKLVVKNNADSDREEVIFRVTPSLDDRPSFIGRESPLKN
jgi:hypothetical protein